MTRYLQQVANAILGIGIAVGAIGCGSANRGPYDASASVEHRNIPEGERLFQKAVAVIDSDADDAESLLNQCLTADLYHGPAHNDLGVLMLRKGKLYEAANEFAWAGKLLPGHPDPRLNLALALDRGGKAAEAIASCKTALEIQPGYLPAIEVATLIQVRDHGADVQALRENLSVIAERESNETWRTWAIEQRLKLENRPQ